MAGGIPDRETFTTEGLLSEHDLPLSGQDCDEVLCPRAAAARFQPVDETGDQLLVQLGVGTHVDGATFERRPLDQGVAVDIRGSMEDGRLEAVKTALGSMIEQLDERDTMALVAFDNRAELLEAPTVMDPVGREHMHCTVDSLRTDGSTDIAAGLQLAYEQVAESARRSQIEQRVMLFTDERPNTGSTSIAGFVELAAHDADRGIGLSAFGVGIDLGAELADEVAHVRGGACYQLDTMEAIEQVFDEDFDTIVSPVACDIEVHAAPAPGLEFVTAWGAPKDDVWAEVDFGASTLFLSHRTGRMGVSLSGEVLEAASRLASFDLSFETLAGELIEDGTEVAFAGGSAWQTEAARADDPGVFGMAGLIDEYLALTAAAEFCDGTLEPEVASARVAETAARLQAAAAEVRSGDADSADGLDAEARLMARLAENLAAGRNACRSHRGWRAGDGQASVRSKLTNSSLAGASR